MATSIKLSVDGNNIVIPVKIEKSADNKNIKFTTLSPKHGAVKEPITRPAVNSKDEVIEPAELAKGIIFEDKVYSFTKADFESFAVDKDKIEVKQFVPISTLNINYIMETYYVIPQKTGQKGYKLFADQMSEKGLMAVCQTVEGGKDRMALVRPYENGLVIHYLYFANEIRPFSPNITTIMPTKEEEVIAGKMIDSMTCEDFDVTKFHNIYNEKVMLNVSKRAKTELIENMEKITESKNK